jgi:hypothetical protein
MKSCSEQVGNSKLFKIMCLSSTFEVVKGCRKNC